MKLDELLAREAIRDTRAKYNVAGDRLRADDFAACFGKGSIPQALAKEFVAPGLGFSSKQDG